MLNNSVKHKKTSMKQTIEPPHQKASAPHWLLVLFCFYVFEIPITEALSNVF